MYNKDLKDKSINKKEEYLFNLLDSDEFSESTSSQEYSSDSENDCTTFKTTIEIIKDKQEEQQSSMVNEAIYKEKNKSIKDLQKAIEERQEAQPEEYESSSDSDTDKLSEDELSYEKTKNILWVEKVDNANKQKPQLSL